MNPQKRSIRLGKTGPIVFPVALGCMGMSGSYGATDEGESIATIRHAIERGITLLDTGDFYGMGHNEMLIRLSLIHISFAISAPLDAICMLRARS